MLEKIMKEVKDAKGPLTVRDLSRRLGVEESAMEGMLEFLERKGRLSVYRPGGECEECAATTCLECVFRGSCPGAADGKGGA